MTENITISKPSVLSIDASKMIPPSVSVKPTEDVGVSLAMTQGLSILVIAPDEYEYRPPEVPNVPPSYTVTDLVEYNEGNTTESVDLFRINLIDPDDPSAELSFVMDSYDSVYFSVRRDSVNKHIVSALIDVPIGSYSFSGTITDSEGGVTAFSKNITVSSNPITVYVYGSTVGANDPNSTEELARERLGSVNGDEIVTSVSSNSILQSFVAGNIGSQEIVVTNGTAELAASGGLRDLKDLDTLGAIDFSSGNRMLVILFPDTSELDNKPSSMYDLSLPSPTDAAGRYAIYANATIAGTTASGLMFFTTSSPIDGYTSWIAILAETGSSGNYSYSYYADEDTPS